jgi:hypothetical protein
MSVCPYCGWPDADPFEVLSSHCTRFGKTWWTRCRCGSLQMRISDVGGTRIAARGRRDPLPRAANA